MIIFETLKRVLGYPYKTSVFYQEDFVSGNSTNGAIGSLGWGTAGGTGSYIATESNHPGIFRLDTTTTSSTISRIYINAQASAILLSDRLRFGALVRLNVNDANTTARVGWMATTNASPSANWFGIEKADADTNWFLVAKVGAGVTRTDSGVAVGTGWIFLEASIQNGIITYYINNSKINTIGDTNVPTSSSLGTFLIHVVNSAAASKTLDIDYAYLSAMVQR